MKIPRTKPILLGAAAFVVIVTVLISTISIGYQAQPLYKSQQPPPPPSISVDTFTKIDDAFQSGKMSYDQRAQLIATALRNRGSLPSEYSSDVIAEDITQYVLDLQHHWSDLSPETKALFQNQGLYDGTTDWGTTSADCGWGTITGFDAVHTTTHFRIHYATTGAHASNLGYATTIGTNAEVGWTTNNNDLGFLNPRPDGTVGGGTGAIDTYIADLQGHGYYGVAFAHTLDASTTGNANDYIGYDCVDFNLPTNRLEATPVHEFHHLVQFAYNAWQLTWMFEATATWFQRKAFPSNDAYLSRVTTFMTYPDESLTDTMLDREYGGAAFLLYLDTQYGNDIVRRAWQRSINNAYTSSPDFNAIRDTIDEFSFSPQTWRTAVFDFWITAYFDDGYSFLARGDHFTVVDQSLWAYASYQDCGDYTGGSALVCSDNDANLEWGGTDQVVFLTTVNNVRFVFDGQDTGDFVVAILLYGYTGGVRELQVKRIPLGPAQNGAFNIYNGLSYWSGEIAVIIINKAYNTGNTDVSWTLTITSP